MIPGQGTKILHAMQCSKKKIAVLINRLPAEMSITSDVQMTPPLLQKAKKN